MDPDGEKMRAIARQLRDHNFFARYSEAPISVIYLSSQLSVNN